jgi:NADH:ubiquinone oxidoreductase subunit 4 (subunit M)
VGITCLIPLFFTVIYSFWLFTRTSMGNYQKFKFLPVTKINDVSRRELLIAFPLIIITIILGIKPQLLMDLVDNSINLIYYKYEYETSRNIY